jgi:hypothetical protein
MYTLCTLCVHFMYTLTYPQPFYNCQTGSSFTGNETFMIINKNKPFTPIFIHSFCSVLSQVHRLFQSKFSIFRSCAPSFNFQYPLFSFRFSSNYLHLLHRIPVTSILPLITPSITCFIRQFPREMWPIQLAFLLFILCKIFLLSMTLCSTSHTIGLTDILHVRVFKRFSCITSSSHFTLVRNLLSKCELPAKIRFIWKLCMRNFMICTWRLLSVQAKTGRTQNLSLIFNYTFPSNVHFRKRLLSI